MTPTVGDSDETSESSVWIPRMLPLHLLEIRPRAVDSATCIHQLRHPPNAPGLDLGRQGRQRLMMHHITISLCHCDYGGIDSYYLQLSYIITVNTI